MNKQRKSLVIGGSGDIGTSIAHQLSKDYGDKVLAVGSQELNLLDNSSIDHFLNKHGVDFDVLVHSAGINQPGIFESLEIEDIEKTIQVNLIGFLRVAKALLPYWKKNSMGRIVIISSLYGVFSRRGRMPYAISKHALIGAMKTMAIEFAEYGVTVNAVSPGFIDTQMTFKNNSPEAIQKIISGIPIARLGLPTEVARAVAFLASPQNTYINGHDLMVDGGYSIGGFQR
jgi:3-oxoacyl-[acyl-carrier protein] reductase